MKTPLSDAVAAKQGDEWRFSGADPVETPGCGEQISESVLSSSSADEKGTCGPILTTRTMKTSGIHFRDDLIVK